MKSQNEIRAIAEANTVAKPATLPKAESELNKSPNQLSIVAKFLSNSSLAEFTASVAEETASVAESTSPLTEPAASVACPTTSLACPAASEA